MEVCLEIRFYSINKGVHLADLIIEDMSSQICNPMFAFIQTVSLVTKPLHVDINGLTMRPPCI